MEPPTVHLIREIWATRSGLGEIRSSSKAEAESLADRIHWKNVYEPFELFGGGLDAQQREP